MMRNKDLVCDQTEKEAIPTDTAEIPKWSQQQEDWLVPLLMAGILFLIVGVIWGIEYWVNG